MRFGSRHVRPAKMLPMVPGETSRRPLSRACLSAGESANFGDLCRHQPVCHAAAFGVTVAKVSSIDEALSPAIAPTEPHSLAVSIMAGAGKYGPPAKILACHVRRLHGPATFRSAQRRSRARLERGTSLPPSAMPPAGRSCARASSWAKIGERLNVLRYSALVFGTLGLSTR